MPTGAGYKGRYFEPTVLTGVTRVMRIYHEESFGPVVSVIRVDDAEQALSIANDTDYGLSAAVIIAHHGEVRLRLRASGNVEDTASALYLPASRATGAASAAPSQFH